MYKFFLIVILAFTACASEEYITDVAGQTLHDNENLLYDNYRYAVFNKKQGSSAMGSDLMEVGDVACVDSCITRPLRIAVIPMSFSYPEILTEIKNTVALVQASHSLQNYNIKVLDSTNLSQELLAYSPDIIIGPFTDSDLKALQQHMQETNTSVPVIALTKGKHIRQSSQMLSVIDATDDRGHKFIYQMGYNAQDDIQSIMGALKTEGYQNFAMFATNDDIGASLYKDFNKIANVNKQDILRVEFYEVDLVDIDKYIARLRKSVKQTYYEHAVTGKVREDTHSFTKHIASKDGNIVTLENKQKYYKKYRILDAIIIDVDSNQISTVLERISQDETLKNITLITSPRSVDAIISTIGDVQYSAIENTILFPSHFALYSAYYNVYRNTFNQKPTRISSTLYEALMYTVKSNEKHDIKEGFKLETIPVFVGLNGTIVLNKETVHRFVNISKMQRGEVTEVVDTYKNSKKYSNIF
jgi:hypothetical protein